MGNKFELPTQLDESTKDAFDKAKIVTPSKDQADIIKRNLELDKDKEEDVIELTEDMIVKPKDKKEEDVIELTEDMIVKSKDKEEEDVIELTEDMIVKSKDKEEEDVIELTEDMIVKSKDKEEEIKKALTEEELIEQIDALVDDIFKEEKTSDSTEDKTAKPVQKKSEPKEINIFIGAGFKEDLNIKKEDLEKVEGFKELSPGQQLLILENLRQIKLGRIHEESLNKSKKQIADAKLLGKVWKGISKKYQILKLEKKVAKEMRKGGIELYRESLNQLIRGVKNFNIEVEIVGGRPEVHYASGFNNLKPEEQARVKNFNKIATKFSRIPDEWSKGTASKEDWKNYEKAKEKYAQARKDILNIKAKEVGEEKAALYMNIIDNNVRLNQFFNTNPEVENQLREIENEKVWKKALKSVITERGIYSASGLITRTVTTSLIGAIGVPLVAAGMGGFMARKRSKETLREKELMARKGIKYTSKEAKNFVDIANIVDSKTKKIKLGLIGKLDKIISKVQTDPNDENIASLNARIKYTQQKITQGLINFGTTEKRLANQYDLIRSLSDAMVLANAQGNNQDLEKRLDSLLGFREKRILKKQKKFVRNQTIKGALIGAGFAYAGAQIAAAGKDFGWWDGSPTGQRPESKPKPGLRLGSGLKPGKPANVIDLMVVKKGESSLLLAKRLYIEHAQELGYKESMGNVNKWAERLSTRHLVGQYISEHSGEYKELIGKIGNPPTDLAQLDKWMSKVPGSTFNDILNNKVSNLIHIGDKVGIGANGDISAFDPNGKLRLGRILVKKEILIPEIVSGDDYNEIMNIDDFSKFSPKQVEKINNVFNKYLGADLESFKSFNKELQAKKIAELDELIKEMHKEKGTKGIGRMREIFLNRKLREAYLVKGIWLKFRVEDVELPKTPEIIQEPMHTSEVDMSEFRGETPIGSEDKIKEIRDLFEKEGSVKEAFEKLIEKVKSGEINRRDFKEFLFDQAREGDNFVSDEEKFKINAIMTKLGEGK